jgi:hypothetical protein
MDETLFSNTQSTTKIPGDVLIKKAKNGAAPMKENLSIKLSCLDAYEQFD